MSFAVFKSLQASRFHYPKWVARNVHITYYLLLYTEDIVQDMQLEINRICMHLVYFHCFRINWDYIMQTINKIWQFLQSRYVWFLKQGIFPECWDFPLDSIEITQWAFNPRKMPLWGCGFTWVLSSFIYTFMQYLLHKISGAPNKCLLCAFYLKLTERF